MPGSPQSEKSRNHSNLISQTFRKQIILAVYLIGIAGLGIFILVVASFFTDSIRITSQGKDGDSFGVKMIFLFLSLILMAIFYTCQFVIRPRMRDSIAAARRSDEADRDV